MLHPHPSSVSKGCTSRRNSGPESRSNLSRANAPSSHRHADRGSCGPSRGRTRADTAITNKGPLTPIQPMLVPIWLEIDRNGDWGVPSLSFCLGPSISHLHSGPRTAAPPRSPSAASAGLFAGSDPRAAFPATSEARSLPIGREASIFLAIFSSRPALSVASQDQDSVAKRYNDPMPSAHPCPVSSILDTHPNLSVVSPSLRADSPDRRRDGEPDASASFLHRN